MTLEDAAIQMRDAFDKLCEAIADSIRAFFWWSDTYNQPNCQDCNKNFWKK